MKNNRKQKFVDKEKICLKTQYPVYTMVVVEIDTLGFLSESR